MIHDLLLDDVSKIRVGDPRLDRRCGRILTAFADRPGLSIPETMETSADTEALYRMLRNPRVTADLLSGPHRIGTWQRAMAAHNRGETGESKGHDCDENSLPIVEERPLLISLHDTSQFGFKGEVAREGLPHDGSKATMHLHLSCVVGEGDVGALFGVSNHDLYAVENKCWIPLNTETCAWEEELVSGSERWRRSVQTVAASCPEACQMVHVMDREADDYGLWDVVLNVGHELLVRGCQMRRTKRDQTTDPAVFDVRQGLVTVAHRSVRLSRRGGGRPPASRQSHPDRDERAAKLEVRVGSATFIRPANYPASWREEIMLNIVHVGEVGAPDDCEPVDWLLYTTLPVDTDEKALRVVDIYRRRWIIEEYFKALKTGCAAEALQLESARTLSKMIAVLVPAAWKLMALRTLSRDDRDIPASAVVDEVEIAVLRSKPAGKSLSESPTVAEICAAVARLGGHLKQNGRPGWAVLHRGLQRLQSLAAGWRLAVEALGLSGLPIRRREGLEL
jgi:hypothetical protein